MVSSISSGETGCVRAMSAELVGVAETCSVLGSCFTLSFEQIKSTLENLCFKELAARIINPL